MVWRSAYRLVVVIVSALSLAPRDVVAQSCSAGRVTPADAEGPFYIAGTPVRDRIAPEDQLSVTSNVLYLEGTIYGNDCVPMDTVLVEPWYAGVGDLYSEVGSDLDYRGQIFTDSCGRYSYTQTFPETYPSRPIRHVHFAISSQDGASRLLTTQMYFKDDPSNTFSPSDLQLRELVTNGDGSRSVVFDMFLDTPGTGDASSCANSNPSDDGSALPTSSPTSMSQGGTPTSNSPVSEVVGKPSASPVAPTSGLPVQSQNNPTSAANQAFTAVPDGFVHLVSIGCMTVASLFL